MATQIHSADRARVQRMVGGLRFAEDQSLLVNANLASTLAVAKAAVVTANLKLHSAHRQLQCRVIPSLDMIGSLDSTYIGGSDVDKATMLALAPNARGGSLDL